MSQFGPNLSGTGVSAAPRDSAAEGKLSPADMNYQNSSSGIPNNSNLSGQVPAKATSGGDAELEKNADQKNTCQLLEFPALH